MVQVLIIILLVGWCLLVLLECRLQLFCVADFFRQPKRLLYFLWPLFLVVANIEDSFWSFEIGGLVTWPYLLTLLLDANRFTTRCRHFLSCKSQCLDNLRQNFVLRYWRVRFQLASNPLFHMLVMLRELAYNVWILLGLGVLRIHIFVLSIRCLSHVV